MKRIIFTLIIFAILATANGQVTRSSVYLVQNSTTNFGIQLWPGSIVSDIATNKTYLISEAAAANQTLETTSGKVEITGNGVNVWDEGVLTVTGASTLNFTGAGVTVSEGGSDMALINIPVSSSGGGNSYLTNTVSVGEFEPNNTCGSDASPAFEAAFTSTRDVVFIPKGCYLIAGTLLIPEGKTLVFEQGAKLDITGKLTGNETNLMAGNFQIFTPRSQLGGTFMTENVLVSWFGAVGDGTTNDHDALSAFFNFISETHLKGSYLPNRTYYTNRPVNVSVGKIFEFDGRHSKMVMNYADFSEDFEEIINFSGRAEFTKSLVEPAKKGALKMKIDDYDGIKIGMGIRMIGGFWLAGSAVYHKGMMNKIVDTVGNGWILLETPIPYYFSVEEINGGVKFYDMHNVTISNLVLEPVGTPSNELSLYNIEATHLFNATFRNITINQPFYMAFRTRSFYNGTFDNITINYSHKDPFGGNYGFSYELLVNCIVKNSTFDQYSTCTTSAKYGSYLLTFDNCLFSSPDSTAGGWAFDSHGDLEVKVINSQVYGIGCGFGKFTFFNCDLWPSAASNKIFHLRYGGFNGKTNVTISNCRVYGNNQSYLLSTFGNYNSNDIYQIANNTFYAEKFLYSMGTNRDYFNNRVVVGDSAFYNLMDTPNYELNNKSYYENFSEGHITIPYDPREKTDITVLIRAKLNENAPNNTDYAFYGTSDGILYYVRIRKGSQTSKIEVKIRNQDGDYETALTQDLENDLKDWHVYAICIGGSNHEINIYVDGQCVYNLDGPGNFDSFYNYAGTDPYFSIGVHGAEGSPFDGKISDFILFEDYLSAGEVNKFSEDLQKSFGPAKICLLDDNANKTLWHDASGNELDGVVQGRAILKSVKKSLHIDDVEVNNRVATNILNLLPTTVPPDPIIGDMYHSAADNLVYIYTESGWEEIRTK